MKLVCLLSTVKKKKYLTYLPNTVVPHLFLLLYFFALSSPLLPVVMSMSWCVNNLTSSIAIFYINCFTYSNQMHLRSYKAPYILWINGN